MHAIDKYYIAPFFKFLADGTGTSDFGHASTNKNDKLLKSIRATDGASAKTDPIIYDPALVKPNHVSVNVVSESAATGKEADFSGIVKEPTLKEPDRVDGELKPSASQNSSAQESNLSSNNTMSGVNGCADEKQVTDASKSNPKPMLHTTAVESALESLDEGYVEVTCNSSTVVPKLLVTQWILRYLKLSLERKLSEISCNGVPSNMPNGGQARKYMDDEPIQEETPRKERVLLNGQVEENVLHGQKDLHVSNGSSAAQEGPAHSESLDHEEKNDSDFHGQNDFMDHRETELVVLENEISDLNDRLEALETDHDFLEYMLYSLQNGNEGLRFVQDIAHQLREFRKLGTAFRCQSVS
ncbi:PREDICTED: myosin-binding [Prunus dulcis]|uniref:PREDICTED: myosin-binding n=1 Tax=Prunus dulcis TaxID=3755 RepID=A0A5E4ER32_PRUDU|nr:PREDICTED: myosin-binding [Prunus dulcis]